MSLGHGTVRTSEKEASLLDAVVSSGGNVTEACKIASIGRTTVFTWSKDDPEFKARLNEAIDKGLDVLEDEARRRAVIGVDEPVFYKGDICGYVRKYSDTLLIFLLNGGKPEKYRQRWAGEISGTGGGPIRIDSPVVVLPDDGSEPDILIPPDARSITLAGAIPSAVYPTVEIPGE